MSDLEKMAFDQVHQFVSGVIDETLSSGGYSYLSQKKIKGRVEEASADFVESMMEYLQQEELPADQQQRLFATFMSELRAFIRDPAALLQDDDVPFFERLYAGKELPAEVRSAGLQSTYSHLFSLLTGFLVDIVRIVAGWDSSAWRENYRLIDQLLINSKSLISRGEQSKGVQPTSPTDESEAPLDFSFEVSDDLEESAPPAEDVSFTAMYPREIGVETWNTLLVYAHLASVVDRIQKDAERFKDEIVAPKQVTAPASTPLTRGTELTIVPQCEGVTFNPQRITLAWLEDFHRAEFRFRADKSLADDAARGRIDIYVGPLIVGTLKMGMLVSESAPQATAPQEEHGTMYHQDDIFISYSHKDTDVVLGFKRAYEAIGDNVLIDIDELRSGQDWNAELLKMIERAEIFQLFWSENSSQSKYCRQEWEYALKKNKGAGFIRPCYWKTPMPTPPDELGHLHFEFVQL